MQIIGSPDITVLDAKVIWDISGTTPLIIVENLSQGSGLANMDWWFVATSPTGTPIHTGDADNIDIIGDWDSHEFNDTWPKPNYSIEWSGAPYAITIYARDSNGLVSFITINATICRPSGNGNTSKNAFGLAKIYIKVICDQGRIYFEDQSSVVYRGIIGTRLNAVLIMSYPLDDTGVSIAPFRLTNFTNVMVPVSYSSPKYEFIAWSIYEYDLGSGAFVRIKYLKKDTFAVLCNIDLSPLACEVLKLNDKIQNGDCENIAVESQKLLLINSKFLLAITGKIEPLAGIDVPKLIDEIQVLGGFTCNCCDTPSGMIGTGASEIDNYTFDVVHVGGDVDGDVSITGTNVQINLHDKSYVFDIFQGSPNDTTAFRVLTDTSVDGYTKYFHLQTNLNQFLTDSANYIKNSSYLLNLWQSIFGSSAVMNLTVDGGCIFQSTSTCNYNFVLNNVPASGTFALLKGIKVGGQSKELSFNFNLSNTTALQSYLNTLGIGAFVVSVPNPNPGNDIYIASTANPNQLDQLTFLISATNNTADITKECTGYVPIAANEVVQKIINHLCNLDDTQIATSQDYIISYLDKFGVKKFVTISAGASLNDVIQAMLDLGNTSISYIGTNSGSVSCDSLKQIFQPNTAIVTGNDILFGTKGGDCSGITYMDVFNYVLKSTLTNQTTKELFCSVVTSCGQGLVCEAFDYVEVFVSDYSTSCTQIQGIEYTLS